MDTQKLLQDFFNDITNYIELYFDENKQLPKTFSSKDLEHHLDLDISDSGSIDRVQKMIDQYLKYSVPTVGTRFNNQLFSGFSYPGFIAEIITALTNTSMYTYEAAPVATLIEKKIIVKLSQIVGYDYAEGTFVTGGSNANLVAVLAALNKYIPNYKTNGVLGSKKKPIMIISNESHYSYKKAALVTGIGYNSIRYVETLDNGSMDPRSLIDTIDAISEDEILFFIGLTAGTTVKGAYDPINSILDIADGKCWIHIDGSWGGGVIFTEKYRSLVNGLERTDSFSIDAHKMIGAPLICSALLFNDKRTLLNLNSHNDAEYLFHDNKDFEFNLGNYSLQCGRRVDALKLWLIWTMIGTKGIEQHITYLYDTAIEADRYINDSIYLDSACELSSVNLCFRFYDPSLDNKSLNQLNIDIRNHLKDNGLFFTNYSEINENIYFRLIVVNKRMTIDTLKEYIDLIIDTGKKIVTAMIKEVND